MPLPPASRIQTEQIVSGSRVALVAASAFAVWLELLGPASVMRVSYGAYAVYALALFSLAWVWPRGSATLAMTTHVVDLIASALFVSLTGAPGSPLFIFFVFSMYSAALRWGWKGTVTTSGVVMVGYLTLVAISRAQSPEQFSLNMVVVRIIYLTMAGGLLVYLGRYQDRLRSEIERLARWPVTAGATAERATQAIVEHAARIVDARHAVIIWEATEEPRVHVATWSGDTLRLSERSPETLASLLPESLANSILMISGDISRDSHLIVSDEHGGHLDRSPRLPDSRLLELVHGHGLVSAPFRTERLVGRAFFTGLKTESGELASLTAVVAREIGTWLDQLHVTRQLQEIATREERLRLARDLHDGVLQSLTGIRLELRSVANSLRQTDEEVQARLFALERALSIEQRELRVFIGGLRPGASGAVSSLAGGLDALRERFALEWNTPVSIRVSPELQECSPDLTQAIPMMVHEAVVNALKHAQPTRVNVNVEGASDRLRIVVSDDGHGFPFKGRFDHRALGESRTAPRSLFDRVTALGGKMSIESSDSGSRVELVVSL